MKLSNRAGANWFFPVIFLLLTTAYITWSWNPELAGMGGDNAVYLLMAKHLSPWASPSTVAKYFFERSQYPPLYPVMLGLFGGAGSLPMAHLITTAALLLSFIIFRVWLLRLGLSRVNANLGLLLFALLPGTVKTAMFIWSENQYLLLTLLALYLTTRFEEEKKSSVWLIGTSLAVAGATLTRGAGISLLAAFWLYLLVNRPRKAPGLALLAALPLTILSLTRSFILQESGPGYLQDFLSHYAADPLTRMMTQVSVESRALMTGWLANFEPAVLPLLTTVFLGISLAGMGVRLYRKRLDAFYLLFYFSLILVWPYPAEAKRMIYVAIPILMVQGLLLVRRSFPPAGAVFQPVSVMLLALLITCLPGTIFMAGRFVQTPPPGLRDYKRTKYFYLKNPADALKKTADVKVLIEDLRSLDKTLPPGAVIYSVKPSFMAFYANRLTLSPPGPGSDWETFMKKLDPVATYFYFTPLTSPSVKTPYYPLALIRNRLEILNIARPYEDINAPVVAVLARIQQ